MRAVMRARQVSESAAAS